MLAADYVLKFQGEYGQVFRKGGKQIGMLWPVRGVKKNFDEDGNYMGKEHTVVGYEAEVICPRPKTKQAHKPFKTVAEAAEHCAETSAL